MADFPPELDSAANEALHETALIYNALNKLLATEGPYVPSADTLNEWKTAAANANKAIRRLARLAWAADDRRQIEQSILLETVRRDALDRESTYALTWHKLRQQTTQLTGEAGVSVDRAISAANQIEHALSALSSVPSTTYHGAPALAQLQMQS